MAKGTEAAGTAAGMAKGAAKALQGYPGVFRHLASEHAEVATLMKRIAKSDDERRELFQELRRNLLAHAHAEEQEFYPQLERYTELAPLVARCKEDHKDVEHKLERLASSDMSADSWLQAFKQMQQAVEAHVEREEKELFPQARDLLSSDQAKQMEEQYEKAEEREKASLH